MEPVLVVYLLIFLGHNSHRSLRQIFQLDGFFLCLSKFGIMVALYQLNCQRLLAIFQVLFRIFFSRQSFIFLTFYSLNCLSLVSAWGLGGLGNCEFWERRPERKVFFATAQKLKYPNIEICVLAKWLRAVLTFVEVGPYSIFGRTLHNKERWKYPPTLYSKSSYGWLFSTWNSRNILNHNKTMTKTSWGFAGVWLNQACVFFFFFKWVILAQPCVGEDWVDLGTEEKEVPVQQGLCRVFKL